MTTESLVAAPVRRGVALTPMETRRSVMLRTAQLADELGYEVFALPEGWGFDSTALLAEIAVRTERIRLASGVLSIWSRTPGTLAMTAATLDEISAGRYLLGLGASTPELTEGFHDVPFVHPADRLERVVTGVRALLAGEPARLRQTPAARPLRLGVAPAPAVRIWVAALGPRTLRVAAELADGWFPALVARDRVAGLAAPLARDASRAPVTIAAGPLTVTGEAAQEIAEAVVAWYVTAMGDAYAGSLRRQGFGAEVDAVRAANPRPSPRSSRIPPAGAALLDQLTAVGTPEQVRAQLERWDTIADVVMVGLPPGLPWPALEATLRAAAPAPVPLPRRHP